MSSSTWQGHFKYKIEGLEAPREGSFLEFAIHEGRINEDEYLRWASTQHLLPILDGKFFTEHSAKPELLSKISHIWRSTLFPIAEWDGHLIIACLEKPEGFEPPSTSFVLAPISAMALWWEHLSSESPVTGNEEALHSMMPEGLFEAPKDQTPSSTPPTLSFAGISLAKPATAATPTEEHPPVAKNSPVDPEVTVATKTPEQAAPMLSSKHEEPAVKPAAVEGVAVQPTPAPVMNSAAESGSNPSIDESTSTKTFIPFAEGALPRPAASIQVHKNKAPERNLLSPLIANRKTFIAEITESLRLLSGCFPKTMFLVIDEGGQNLVPFLWSESFGEPSSVGKIPLTPPSLFRIALTTEKSYHGYVVSNEINESFLKTWNHGTNPNNLTFVPMMYRGRMVGGFVGLADFEGSQFQYLRHAEKVSADLTKKIGGLVEGLAA